MPMEKASCTPLPPISRTSCRTRPPSPKPTCGLVYDPHHIHDGYDAEPLHIYVQHGRRKYEVTLRPRADSFREEVSMHHLAETVHSLTKVKPAEQRFLYKGVTWDSCARNIGQFSPLLRDLGIKNGDKILLVTWPSPVTDYAGVETLKELDSEMKIFNQILQDLIRQMEVLDHIYGPCGSGTVTLSQVRQQFLDLQAKYMMAIQRANSLIFDHRNAVGQTNRRELVDDCQRQMDLCSTAASHLFDRMALAKPVTSFSKNRRRSSLV